MALRSAAKQSIFGLNKRLLRPATLLLAAKGVPRNDKNRQTRKS
jgi:hypothetical protein